MDDIVELSAGGQIPADAVVLEGQLNVNESLLTGEADEIVKKMAMNCCRQLCGVRQLSGTADKSWGRVYISKLTTVQHRRKRENSQR